MLLGLLACSPAPPRYQTRGVVRARTGTGAETRYAIHHEPIPTFKGREGEPAPMDSMMMMFGLADGVHVDEVAPGTKVSVSFDVVWSSGEALRVTRMQPLPDATVLDLRAGAAHGKPPAAR
ncbi:MAG: copper-binding protein [Polyangiales bacterium]